MQPTKQSVGCTLLVHPAPEESPFLVTELTEDDEDEVDDDPDAEAARGDYHENAGADFPHVEAVDAEPTEKAAEKCGGEA